MLGAAQGGCAVTACHSGGVDFVLQLLSRGRHDAHASLLCLQCALDSGKLGVELVILEVVVNFEGFLLILEVLVFFLEVESVVVEVVVCRGVLAIWICTSLLKRL